ncbi:MAG: hypothetical protein AAB368_00080, partial [bacterium]
MARVPGLVPRNTGYPSSPARQPPPGGPGDPARWQTDPTGQKYNWRGDPGNETWQTVGGSDAAEEAARTAAERQQRDYDYGTQRQQSQTDATMQYQHDQGDLLWRLGLLDRGADGASGRITSANGPGPPPVPRIAPPDESGAQALAFGRAKDKAGMAGRAAMRGLSREMNARGIEGSGIEGDRMAGIMGGVAGNLSDVATSQALEELRRLAAVNDRNYAGGI